MHNIAKLNLGHDFVNSSLSSSFEGKKKQGEIEICPYIGTVNLEDIFKAAYYVRTVGHESCFCEMVFYQTDILSELWYIAVLNSPTHVKPHMLLVNKAVEVSFIR